MSPPNDDEQERGYRMPAPPSLARPARPSRERARHPDSPRPPRPPLTGPALRIAGGVRVSTYDELAAAWASSEPAMIVLEPGDYHGAPLTGRVPHRLRAAEFGAVTLHFGIAWGHNSLGTAGELHGLRFSCMRADVPSVGVENDAIVTTWGACSGLRVRDCVLDGHGDVGSAIQALNPRGLLIERTSIWDCLDWGILAFRNGWSGDELAADDQITIRDVSIQTVHLDPRGLGVGPEAGIWIGHRARLSRVRVSNTGWAGVAVVNGARHVTIEDLHTDATIGQGYRHSGGVGLYLQECSDVVVRRFRAGPLCMYGVVCEWNGGNPDPALNDWVPKVQRVHFAHVLTEAYKVGISLDMTVQDCTIERARCLRSWRAGVLDYNDFAGRPTTNAVDLRSCSARLAEGVPLLLHAHHLGPTAEPPDGWPATPSEPQPFPLREIRP